MNDSLAVAAMVATAGLLAFAPNNELGFLLQFFGAGLALGMLVAYRALMRNPKRDTFAIQARWAAIALAGALFYMLIEGVFS
jgi:hypothetical protein